MNETLDYLKTFATFPFALRRFLRQRLTLDEARRTVRDRLAQREANFLRVVEQGVYGSPRSPYLALLKWANCELGDLRNLVAQNGLEGALRSLRAAGVYVTFEEFKGRKVIERPGLSLAVQPRDFDNPQAQQHFKVQTGGSTGVSTYVGQDLDFLAATAPLHMLEASAHGVAGVPAVRFGHMLLPGPGMRSTLMWAHLGVMMRRCFEVQGLRDSRYWLKYGLATYYMLSLMRLSGLPVPWPEFPKPGQPLEVARYVHDVIRSDGACLVLAGLSRSMRICLAAREAGLDLTGAVFRSGGEAPTPAKAEAMRQVGGRLICGYSMMETGAIGVACAQPSDESDVHLAMDSLALITHPYHAAGWDEALPAFNLTTLQAAAPKLMLNVQIDDYGVVEERQCGCSLGAAGLTTHLRQIRSYTKITGEGATLIAGDMARIIEDVLPARFGGNLMDYQLVEEEDEQGFTRLILLVSPRVPAADEAAIVATVLRALRDSSSMADAARSVWQRAETIRVRRSEPVLSGRGKFNPVLLRRSPQLQPHNVQAD